MGMRKSSSRCNGLSLKPSTVVVTIYCKYQPELGVRKKSRNAWNGNFTRAVFGNFTSAVFRIEKFAKVKLKSIVVFSFVCGKYCPTMD